LHRSPDGRRAGARALEIAGVGVDDLALIDLYSCFPSAVQVHAHELGLALDRPLTQTGGMSLAGGPLNNYVLQAMVRLAGGLRSDPVAIGLSSSVSGYLTKHGFGVWSANPPGSGRFRNEDVTAELADEPQLDVDADLHGEATVVSSTVVHDRGNPHRVVAIVEAPGARVRSIVESTEPSVVTAFMESTRIGEPVVAGSDGQLTLG
jgi:acetyl-CoA C-acetyltransferase